MKLPSLVLVLLTLSAALPAEWRSLPPVTVERFDEAHDRWVPLSLPLAYQAEPEGILLRLPKAALGKPLTARLDFKRLPHFSEWLAMRQAQGGASWTALNALLQEVGDGPAMALSSQALQSGAQLQIKVGLRRQNRFELYATVSGELRPCKQRLCFEPAEPVFARQSAALVWKLLKPLARAQLKAGLQR